jgi:TonB family protein
MTVKSTTTALILILCFTAALALGQADNGSSPATTAPPPLPDSTKLKIAKIVKPIYPLAAERNQIQGQVIVRVNVDQNGNVERAQGVSGDALLLPAAVDAIKKWKFEPYIKNGHAVPVTADIPFDFAFSGNIHDVKNPDAIITEHVTKAPVQKDATVADLVGVPPSRTLVAQGVTQGLLLHGVAPVYPAEAKMRHIQGKVVLKAVIGKDGKIKELEPLSGPHELVLAAVGAVQQWRYRPYLLQGEPVEIETQVTVNFVLQR